MSDQHRPTWRQPIWLVGHIVAVVAIIGFGLLGMWQFDRHQARSDIDAVLADRQQAASQDYVDIKDSPIETIEYTAVLVTGEYDFAHEQTWISRIRSGLSGEHLITPLRLADGSVVLVDRGWVPLDTPSEVRANSRPNDSTVTFAAIVRSPQSAQGPGPQNPQGTDETRFSRLIPEQLSASFPYDVIESNYVQRTGIEQDASGNDVAADFPLVGTLPEVGGGPPHLSYAVQWFVFALVVAIGYPILLNRTEAQRRKAVVREMPVTNPPNVPSTPSSAP